MSAPTTTDRIRGIVAEVPDPELPMITIDDLGILRDVWVDERGHVIVEITPTYTGCPAMEAIRADVLTRLAEHGHDGAEVRLVLAPAWTTDWISPAGRETLRRHGIVPPGPAAAPDPAGTARGRAAAPRSSAGPVELALTVRCPQCGSPDTRELSRFGSTPCKALWACRACGEPFDHMKAL